MRFPSDRVRLAAVTVAALLASTHGTAQTGPVNGMRPADLRRDAIVDATVITAPGQRLEGATVLLRDGVIEAIGVDLPLPDDARRWDGEGLTVYPGLIEAALLVKVEPEPASPGDHWNARVHPQLSIATRAVPTAGLRKEMRALGFTAAAVYADSGIFRGSGMIVALADGSDHQLTYRERAAMAMGFDYGGSWATATYPGSLMGAMALIRQTIRDARWHETCRAVYANDPGAHEPPIRADALVALDDAINRRQRILFDANTELNTLRAARLAGEFDLDIALLGRGLEFRRLDEIVATGLPLIVPLNFPERPAVDTLAAADRVTLREMQTWEQAPTNPRRLIQRGADVSLTTHRLKKRSTFQKHLYEAIRHGLSEDDALAALTTRPARLLGLQEVMGTIEAGKVANLVVVDGSLFDKKPKIRDVWINGRRHEISAEPTVSLVASGRLTTDRGVDHPVTVNTKKKKVSVEVGEQTVKAKKVVVQQDQLSFIMEGSPFEVEGFVRLSGAITDGEVTGTGVLPDGAGFTFRIVPAADGGDVPDLADADADDDDDDRGGRSDGPAGRWRVTATGAMLPEPLKVTIEVNATEDGMITGTVDTPDGIIPFDDGIFNDGRLIFDVLQEGRRSTVVANIEGDSLDGVVEGQLIVADITGSRIPGDDGNGEETHGEGPFEMPPAELLTPLGAYGLAEPPRPQPVLVTDATIWTCGPQGIIENADLLAVDGRIVRVGRNLGATIPLDPDTVIIDGTGKHVTPGLIDCHSHTGINGSVNEWTQANTAEVRIGDCVDPDDVNWYRQLAGGLTAANQLHGSANPIGGQNSVVKLRWGGTSEDFAVSEAIGGIKFALGENVKRSDNRYPDTRMGVETFIRDAFTAAREYQAAMNRYDALSTERRRRTMPPKPDLELETLAEILGGTRLIHCHSYRQDEILMLIRIADDFGFTIGTFQHILEGYKVADAIAEHGAGGSSFSDWWAYKMEVMDAIPHNGALMTEVGVVMSFNSDSSELARRMNTEASKAVRYGGMDRHEALKLVTLNPAIQLRIDGETGSLERDKDADFAIWSDDPLSTYARCEETWIDGARHFSLEQDEMLRQRDAAERQRLIQKILVQAHGGSSGKSDDADAENAKADPGRPVRRGRLMARMIEQQREWMEEQVRLGGDPDEIRPGRCACNDVWFRMMMGMSGYAGGEE